MFLSLVFIRVIFKFINNISGWNFYEALIIVGSYMLVEGLMWATCAFLTGISKNIQRGTMDFILSKPIDPQFMVTIWRADPDDWGRVLTALLVFGYAIKHLDMPAGILIAHFPLYLLMMLSSYIILYSLVLFIKSLSFWFIEANSLSDFIFNTIFYSQYPTDIFFHKAVRIFFSTVIPLAFMATVPAKILLHGFDLKLVGSSIILAAVFFIFSRKFWKYSLKYYSSASS